MKNVQLEKVCSIFLQCSRVRLLFSFISFTRFQISLEPCRCFQTHSNTKFNYPPTPPFHFNTRANQPYGALSPPCPSQGVLVYDCSGPSPEALSLQVKVVTLPALVIQSRAKVCACTCIHLSMTEIKKKKSCLLSRPTLSPSPENTRTDTCLHSPHRVQRTEWQRVTVSLWQKKRDKLSARPAAPVWRREERQDGRVESEELPHKRSPAKFGHVLYL